VAQTAVKLMIEPIFEADLEPSAYGYRPKRSGQDAVQKVDELLHQGYTDVVDADLSKYFDTIPQSELMQCVARRIVAKHMLHLLKMWHWALSQALGCRVTPWVGHSCRRSLPHD
jgi:RNA-directed DNA polymerase